MTNDRSSPLVVSRGLVRILQAALLLVALLWGLVGLTYRGFYLPQVLLAVGFAWISGWLPYRSPKLALGLTSFGLFMVVAWFSVSMFAPKSEIIQGNDWRQTKVHRDQPTGLWTSQTETREHRRDFDVIYRCDPNGFRITPNRALDSDPSILFLGCSFTFGIGVNDTETYSAVLAQSAWPNIRVVNLAKSGWSPVDGLEVLKTRLAVEKPQAVFYGWIAHQSRRVHQRKSWHDQQKRGGSRHIYDVQDDQLVDLGTGSWGYDVLPDDDPQLAPREEMICYKIFVEMNRICKSYHIPFIVLNLQKSHDDGSNPVIEKLVQSRGIPVLDFSERGFDLLSDWHPRASWHRWVAYSMAKDSALAHYIGTEGPVDTRITMEDPSCILAYWEGSELPVGDFLRPLLKIDPLKPMSISVGSIDSKAKEGSQQAIRCRIFRWENSVSYSIRFRGRSDVATSIGVYLGQISYPLNRFSGTEQVALDSTWKDIVIDLKSTASEENGALWFEFGGSPSQTFDIDNLSIVKSGESILPRLPVANWLVPPSND